MGTVVGNRVNCRHLLDVRLGPLGTGTAPPTDAAPITVPDGLGGWRRAGHQNGQTWHRPYYVKRSIDGRRLLAPLHGDSSRSPQGLGWTQLDNTIAVDYDNSYVGYGCGFNSQGDVVMNLVASGAPGTHLIDMYPLLYTQQPSYANTPYGMIPVLTYEKDAPGLALGYTLPAIRLAITVVK